MKNLRNLGYFEISEAENGIEALRVGVLFKPDIILVDIKMPKMDGMQFISEFKKISGITPGDYKKHS